jgi:putative N-acetylmannosamine-6-phosphate epimerase
MKDLNSELEKLLLNAEDCELIARLATDRAKRETFSRIAKQLREMAGELMADIAARSAHVS